MWSVTAIPEQTICGVRLARELDQRAASDAALTFAVLDPVAASELLRDLEYLVT